MRYLTQDNPAQFAKAAAFIDAASEQEERFLVNTPVLCELVWGSTAVYDYSREEIAEALEQIFTTAQFEIERLDEARKRWRFSLPQRLTSATR